MTQNATSTSASDESTTITQDEMKDPEDGERAGDDDQETVPPAVRERVLERDEHRCQLCGRQGPANGGLVPLEVHHIDRDPDGMDEHDAANLTTLCRACHSWVHQQTTRQEAPVQLTEADEQLLLAHDREILAVLDEIGPAMASDVADALTADLSVLAVRERLWTLMGLDNAVESRERQIVDQDAASGEWGLTNQIATSSRGRIPDETQLLLKRAADERVRQALDRGVDRETVADVFGIHPRTTWIKQKRGRAYDFPLSIIVGSGGRPSGETDEDTKATSDVETGDEHQEQLSSLTATAGQDVDSEEMDAEQHPGAAPTVADGQGVASDAEAREQLRQALNALEGVEAALRGE